MSKYKTLSLHYIHPSEYVLEIHRNLREFLNKQDGFDFDEPIEMRIGITRAKEMVSEYEGIRIRATTHDKGDNSLIVDIEKERYPSLSKLDDLRRLDPEGNREIFGSPTDEKIFNLE